MDFALNEERRLLTATVRRFVESELIPLEDEVEEKGSLDPELAQAIFEKSKALGFYAMNIPKAHGGGGLSALDVCLVEEQFGHTKDILIRRAFGNVYDVLLEGDPEQRERWLLPAVRGERTCSIAISEPGAGSDAAGIKTRARRESKGWILSGQKHFISDRSISSATACFRTFSSSRRLPIPRPAPRASPCSWSTRTCRGSPWGATNR
jgi:acyl-CoA dehydrogenase